MQYRLRTLMIVLALGPPIVAAIWFNLFVVAYFAILLAMAFLLFLCALGAAVVIGRLVDPWVR